MVKLACARPEVVGRSLSQGDSAALARQLVYDGVVEAISPQTVQRMLAHHKLKPWRHHLWLAPPVPREAAFAAQGHDIVTLYTRPLGVWEQVLCVDETTSVQPRTRTAPSLSRFVTHVCLCEGCLSSNPVRVPYNAGRLAPAL